MLASLNHPNIATSTASKKPRACRPWSSSSWREPTLAERIARGPIPLEEALAIARQMAEALEAAHEQGIIHRDLKPANVKVRPDGAVKVLDFGLAKMLEPPAERGRLPSSSPPPGRDPACLLGTAAYMSPEQAARQARSTARPTCGRSAACCSRCSPGGRVFEGETTVESWPP